MVELLLAAGLPARLAGRAVELFGAGAHRLLRDDPWRLLQLPGVEVADADALARVAIPGVAPSDPRRSRALVGFVLARVARDGHTVLPADEVGHDLELYRVADPDAAIADACAGETCATVYRRRGRASCWRWTATAAAEQAIADAVHRLTGRAAAARRAQARKDRRQERPTRTGWTRCSAARSTTRWRTASAC